MDTRPSTDKKKQLELLAYKLLNDILFIWIIVFAAVLLAEVILPGFVSGYVSFTKLVFAFVALSAAIGYLSRRNKLYFELSPKKGIWHNKFPLALLALAFIFIANSLRGIGAANVLIISFATLVILFLFYKVLIVGDEE